jgi:hypothetical protein
MRARLGWRWDTLRLRAVALLQSGLQRDLTLNDLLIEDGAQRLYVVRASSDRRQIERDAELLAADVTARLCGTIPGGAIIRVASLPFDPGLALAGVVSPDDLLARLERICRQPEPETPARADLPHLEPATDQCCICASGWCWPTGSSRWSQAEGAAREPEAALGEALDGWALQRTAEALREPRRRTEPALIVPVHYPSLASRRPRDQLMQLCRELPPRSSRQLVFELLGLPAELPQARVRELLAYLRPFCLTLLVRLPGPNAGIDHLVGTGTRGVSAALCGDLGEAEGIMPALSELAGKARIHGLRSMLVDVDDPRSCRWAAGTGIDHVCGNGLMPPLRRPGRAFMVA